jgi:hypothetical protein
MMVRGRTGSRPVRSSSIIGVFPVRDRVQLIVIGDRIFDPAEQLVLAEKAAVRTIRLIFRALIFVRFNLDDSYTDLACDIVSRRALVGSQTRGHSKQRHDSRRAESPGSQGE